MLTQLSDRLLSIIVGGMSLGAVDRAHRVGEISTDGNGVPRQQMIARFKTFFRAIKKTKKCQNTARFNKEKIKPTAKAGEFAKNHDEI